MVTSQLPPKDSASLNLIRSSLRKAVNLINFTCNYSLLFIALKIVIFTEKSVEFLYFRRHLFEKGYLLVPHFVSKAVGKLVQFILDQTVVAGSCSGSGPLVIIAGEGANAPNKAATTTADRDRQRINISHAAELILSRVKQGIGIKMDQVLNAYLTAAVGDDGDFPSCESPVWIFGRSYSVHYDIEELRRSVLSCLWITYRKNFPSISGTTLTSDRGWGCMIRVGQMLVGKALLLRHLDQNWHWDPECRDQRYLRILSLFEDSKRAPLSLHRIAESGASLGKSIGAWLGPNTVAQALRRLFLCDQLMSANVDLAIHIAMDSTLVKGEIKRECLVTSSTSPGAGAEGMWKPLLLVVPLRLGLSDLNDAYIPGIKGVLENPHNIGIIGGRPNHALYFIGYADKEVLYLDPHTVQSAVSVSSKQTDEEKAADETYHIRRPGRMSFSSMDPSIALCFFCRTEAEFEGMCTKLNERFMIAPLPLFEICEERPDDVWIAGDVNIDAVDMSNMMMPGGSSSSSSCSHPVNLSPLAGASCNSLSPGNASNESPPSAFTKNKKKSKKGSKSSDTDHAEDDEDFEILG